eukprot:gene22450-29071_t
MDVLDTISIYGIYSANFSFLVGEPSHRISFMSVTVEIFSSTGSNCCNPGYVCVGNSAYAQCAPLQPPLCSKPSGFSPLPTQRPLISAPPSKLPSSVIPTSVSPRKPPSVNPISVSPRKPPSVIPSVTRCVADYGSGCNIVAALCCNPGFVCDGNNQCAPTQPPLCTVLSGYIVEPLLTQSPSSSSVSPIFRPSITPIRSTAVNSVAPSNPTNKVTTSSTSSPSILTTALPTKTQAPNIKVSSVLSTKGNQIVDSNGNSVRLTGINWFGYETHDGIVHGLWTRNYKSMLDQVKELHFNVLRIPFCNQNLIAGTVPSSPDYSKNPDLVGLSSLETLDKIVAYSGSIGLRIFLDRHSAKADNYPNEPLWYIPGDAYYTEERFIADWVMLAERYRGTAVIGADLWNEPKI